jgi:hypothetical protein
MIEPASGFLITLSDPPPGGNHAAADDIYARSAFASVLLPLKPPQYAAKVLICGEKQARIFELNNAQLGWQEAGDVWQDPRAYLNAVILPDASVLVVGGAKSEKLLSGGEDKDKVTFAQQYFPDTNQWIRRSASDEQHPDFAYPPIARVYHSVALLLADGRIWIAGSNHDSQRNKGGVREDDPNKGDARELSMEVYSPPYLFNGTGADGKPIPAVRPTIERVRYGASYNQQFTIYTPDAPNIATVALIRCSSTTHAFNQDQRYVGLVIDQAKKTPRSLVVTAPPTPQIAPPGYYMLLILTLGEKPSIAKFFKIGPTYPLAEVYLGRDGAMGNAPIIEAGEPVPPQLPSINLSPMQLGQTRTAIIRCRNVGSGKLIMQGRVKGQGTIRTEPGPFGSPPKNAELVISRPEADPGQFTELLLTFTPGDYGEYSGTIEVLINAPEAAIFEIKIDARVEGFALEITPAPVRDIALDFGDVPVGTSKTLAITVRNVGTVNAVVSDLVFDRAEVPPGQFHWPFVIPDRSVPVGQVRTFDITYMPTVVGEGYAEATLLTESTPAPPSYQQSRVVVLGGKGIGPVVELTPPGLIFPDQLVRTASPSQTVTLKNTGTAPLVINSISCISNSNDFGQTNACPSSLAPGQSCSIAVTFHPGNSGARPGTLSIESNAVGSPHTVVLTGIGLVEPILTLSTVKLDFGSQPVGTSGAEQTVRLWNDGAANLQINSVAVTGVNASDFIITAESCDRNSVPPEGACEVSIRFNPSALGSQSAIIEFSSNAGGSPHQVALSGIGASLPALTLNPTSLNFDNQSVGTRSATLMLTLTNNGASPINIADVNMIGPNASDFAITTTTCRGASMLPGDSCVVSIAFSPAASGKRSASLMVNDNVSSSPHIVPLEGTGLGPVLNWDPPSLIFPPQPVGSFSQRQQAYLKNTGNAMLTVSNITISSDFKYRPLGGMNVAAGGFLPIDIICSPTTSGLRSGELVVASNAPGSPHRLALSGTGQVPIMTLSQSSLAFGSQRVNSTSPAQRVTVTNTGTGPLIISSVGLGGANPGDFIIGANSCAGGVLQPGSSCTVEITFTPAMSGSRSADLVFTNNATNSPQSIPLAGSGS